MMSVTYTCPNPACGATLKTDKRVPAGKRLARDGEMVRQLAILQHVHAGAVLADDRARVAADKGIAAQVFAAFDRFEEERFALPADFPVGREGRFKISQEPAGNGDEVPLGGQLLKFFQGGRKHGGRV